MGKFWLEDKVATKEDQQGSGYAHIHNDFFKEIYKNPVFFKEILALSFTDEEIEEFDLASLHFKESEAKNVSGKSRRADFVVSVKLKKKAAGDETVTIYVVLEFKSQNMTKVILQIMEYYTELCRRTGGVVIPLILMCCKDENFEPPRDYLSWVFRGGEIPAAVHRLSHLIPNFFCRVVNLHKIPLKRIWEKAKSTGVVVYGVRRFWQAGKDDVAIMVKKSRLIPAEHKGVVMIPLTDYYANTDKGLGLTEFDRVDRECWPDLNEEERLMPTLEFSLDKAKNLGLKQGMEKGMEQGMEQGMEKGMEKGQWRNQVAVAARMLARGMSDEQIRDVLQLSAKELADIKQELKN